ncbi:MAG: hypothetical protein HY223_04395 [Thaumarchaeota archaeon]|nr:hypothetical protein [Nitrososphaerota archaeon]
MERPKYVALLILVSVLLLVPLTSFGAKIDINPLMPWNCPPTGDPTAPAPITDIDGDNKTDRLYVHIEDKNGNDYEIWCLDHGAGGDFAAYVSFPNGTSKYLDKCEMECGKNHWYILVNGSAKLEEIGNQTFTFNGTIKKEVHHNWVPPDELTSHHRAKDYHSFYNPITGNYTRIDTVIDENNTEHIVKTSSSILFSYNPGFQLGPNFVLSDTIGSINELPPENEINSTEIDLESNGQTRTFEVWYPEIIGINDITFSKDSLIISLNSNHAGYMNLSIPKGLLDHPDGGTFSVTADEMNVIPNENATSTYRTLDFAISQDAKVITISSVIPSNDLALQSNNQKIPSWIKNNAKSWSQGQAQDSDFVKGIQYMLEQGIVKIPPSPGGYLQNSNQIPSWIKNNAKWWSEGQIDDSEFVKGMQYLVQVGIIQVNIVQQQQGVLKLENSTQQTDQSSVQSITPTTCKSINDILPDPNCTPGATNPTVTQANIYSTICVSGYTKTVRPPTSVTDPIKLERMQAYGFTDSKNNYELDHLIPLELGGAPSDVRNLWPEPYYTNQNSYDKDGFENYLHDKVCSGAMTLQTAQNEIATNWVKYWSEIHPTLTIPSQTTVNTNQPIQKTNSQSLGTLNVNLQGQNVISRGSTQSMTVTVTDGSNPVTDASVLVHVTYASGSTTKDFGGMTDYTGQYNFSWQIGGNSTPGTFDVVDASKDGYSSAHGTFSFQVVPAY